MAILLVSLPAAQAQFVQTAENVIQHSNLESRVIVSQKVPGLFVSVGPRTGERLFDPRSLKLSNSLDAFLEFEPETSRCGSVWIRSKRYAVHGNAILTLGDLRVSIDNSLPLVTITDGSGESVLGFSGTTLTFNKMDVQSVVLLETNQLGTHAISMHYTIMADGLLHRGAPVSSENIGINVELRYPKCFMKPDAYYLWDTEVAAIRALPTSEERMELLNKLIDENSFAQLMSDSIAIRVEEDEALLYRENADDIISAQCRRRYVLISAE